MFKAKVHKTPAARKAAHQKASRLYQKTLFRTHDRLTFNLLKTTHADLKEKLATEQIENKTISAFLRSAIDKYLK